MAGYGDDWREYKRIRNIFLLVFALSVPVCFSIGALSVKLFHTFAPGFAAAVVWMVFLAISGTRVNLWRCPNCGEWFSGTWWYNLGLLARRCVHCGLPKYAETPPAAGESRSTI